MSMTLHIFSGRRVQSMAEWQEAVQADGFDAEFYKDAIFEDLNGFLPVRMFGVGTGYEVYLEDAKELTDELTAEGWDVGGPWASALTFRWGGDFRELISAYATAASYARITNGVVFDSEEAKVYPPAEALELAFKIINELKDHLEPPLYEWDKV